MKRLFIAIDIIPEKPLLDAFENIRHTLRMEKINWVNAEKMHLTLVFLGDTDENVIVPMAKQVGNALKLHHSFGLTLSGIGVFRNIHDPRVIWTGVEASEEFAAIKSDVDKALAPLGVEPEDRPFKPHLTLGRIKFMRQQNHLSQLIGQYQNVVFQTNTIHEIIFYESFLKPLGPEYRVINKFMLFT